jgi:hypothetical protein
MENPCVVVIYRGSAAYFTGSQEALLYVITLLIGDLTLDM